MTKRSTDSDENCGIEGRNWTSKVIWGAVLSIIGTLATVVGVLLLLGLQKTEANIDKKVDRVEFISHIEKNDLQFSHIKESLDRIVKSQERIERTAIMRYEKNEPTAKGTKN